MHLRKILFPTDFSKSANEALATAIAWAGRFDCELDMLHAIVLHGYEPVHGLEGFPDEDEIYEFYRRQAEDELESLSQQHPAVVRQVHRRGVAPAPIVLDYAVENDIDLIVMATHGRRGPRRLLVGSVTEEVVRKAPCPVLAVKSGRGAAAEIRRILVPLDFSVGSPGAVAAAKELAAVFSAEIDLLHVVEQPPYPVFYEAVGGFSNLYPPGLERESREHLEKLFAEAEGPAAPFTTHVRTGIPAEEILRFIDQGEVDLLIAPTHGLTGVSYALLGSVAEKLVRRAPCPVLVTRFADESD